MFFILIYVLYKSRSLTLIIMVDSWYIDEYWFMGPRGRFYSYMYHVIDVGIGYIQVLYLGRSPRTKETLPDFHEWHRVTRHPLVFRGLTGSQRTLGDRGVTTCPQNSLQHSMQWSCLQFITCECSNIHINISSNKHVMPCN